MTAATATSGLAVSPWGPRARTQNARRLLVGGLVGSHLAAIVVVGIVLIVRGAPSAAVAAIAAVVVIAFYTIGHGVQVVLAESSPRLVLVASLTSYLLRVGVLGLLLVAAMRMPQLEPVLDRGALFAGAVVTLLGWLAAEITVFSRLRIPVYDTEYVPPVQDEQSA